MSDIPGKSKLDEYVKMGLVRSQTHPTLPLTIYVYAEAASFERLWNNVTTQCRGLVVDDTGRCIVRCLPKFFNEDEPHALCDMPKDVSPIVLNKLDGSLIQVANDKQYGLVVTSKGSFGSDQAKWARQIIDEKYSVNLFEQGITYVFELIHPENRIVLDYGDTRALFLIAAKDTEGGQEYDIFSHRFDAFDKVDVIPNLEKHMEQLVEGVVVKTGEHRYKLKTGEYLRLHRIVTEFTPKRVWEALSTGDNLEFKNMPEEFDKWLKDTIIYLQKQYDEILDRATDEYEETKDLTDKEVGLSGGVLRHKHLVFMLRNGKDITPAIWKMVKPKKEVTDEATDA
jgi:RNA ligase